MLRNLQDVLREYNYGEEVGKKEFLILVIINLILWTIFIINIWGWIFFLKNIEEIW